MSSKLMSLLDLNSISFEGEIDDLLVGVNDDFDEISHGGILDVTLVDEEEEDGDPDNEEVALSNKKKTASAVENGYDSYDDDDWSRTMEGILQTLDQFSLSVVANNPCTSAGRLKPAIDSAAATPLQENLTLTSNAHNTARTNTKQRSDTTSMRSSIKTTAFTSNKSRRKHDVTENSRNQNATTDSSGRKFGQENYSEAHHDNHQGQDVDDTAERLLQQARLERETARDWASRMRQAVQTWMALQRRHQRSVRDAGIQMTLQKEQIRRRHQETVDTLESTIRDLEHDMKGALQHHLSVQERLYDTIREHEYQIARLRDELEVERQAKNAVTAKLQHETNTTAPQTPGNQARANNNKEIIIPETQTKLTLDVDTQEISSTTVPVAEPSPAPQQTVPPTPFHPEKVKHFDSASDETTTGSLLMNLSLSSDFSSSSTTSSNHNNRPHRSRQSFVDNLGTRHTLYQNGAHRQVHADGTTVVYHANNDIETTKTTTTNDDSEQQVIKEVTYYYHATQTLQRRCLMTRVDGDSNEKNEDNRPTADEVIIWEYPNGQIETQTGAHKRVQFPDGTFYEFSTTPTLA